MFSRKDLKIAHSDKDLLFNAKVHVIQPYVRSGYSETEIPKGKEKKEKNVVLLDLLPICAEEDSKHLLKFAECEYTSRNNRRMNNRRLHYAINVLLTIVTILSTSTNLDEIFDWRAVFFSSFNSHWTRCVWIWPVTGMHSNNSHAH